MKLKRRLCLLAALALTLCQCSGAFAQTVLSYTVADKLIKQLQAGSGFTGTLEAAADGEEGDPLSLQWSFIHVRESSEFAEQDRLDLSLMNGEETAATAQLQRQGGVFRFQTDLLGSEWYEYDAAGRTEAEGTLGSSLQGGLTALLRQYGAPSVAVDALPLLLGMTRESDDLNALLDEALTRMDIWIEGYRGKAEIGKLEDGSGTLETSYRISPANIKAQLKTLLLALLEDPGARTLLAEHFGEETAELYLRPEWQPYYFAAIDALPLNGDLTIERKVSMTGETIFLRLSLPFSDPELGDATLRYTREKGGDAEPDNEIAIESEERVLRLSYLQYSTLTDVYVTQGVLTGEAVGEEAYTVSGEQEQPLAVAFLLRSQTSAGVEEDGRESFRAQYQLSLSPDQERQDALTFDPLELQLDLFLASKTPQKAATEVSAVLKTGGGQRQERTCTLNGKTRTPWAPVAVPEQTVSLSALTQEEGNALLQKALTHRLFSRLLPPEGEEERLK